MEFCPNVNRLVANLQIEFFLREFSNTVHMHSSGPVKKLSLLQKKEPLLFLIGGTPEASASPAPATLWEMSCLFTKQYFSFNLSPKLRS